MKNQIKNQLAGKKILFATIASDGHFNPLTGLAMHLKSHGCDVRWYTSKLYRERLDKLQIPLFQFEQVLDVNGVNIDEIFPERKDISDPGAKADFDMTVFAKFSSGFLLDILEIRNTFSYDLIIADNAFSAIPLLSAKLDIPVVSVGVMPLAEDSADLGPFGLGLHPPVNEEQRKEYSQLKDLFINAVFKGSIAAFNSILVENGLPAAHSVIFDTLIKRADLHLQIGSPSLEYNRSDISPNVRFIGSLLPYKNVNGAEKWHDAKIGQYEKTVLVTQGTVEKDATKLLVPTLEAFKDTDLLVIATTGGTNTEELRQKFNFPNIIIEDFLPFDDIMPIVDVFITNGGYSGTLLGIKNKLPMVTAGIHEGKAEICSRIGYFGYGIDLRTETPSPEAIKTAVDLVISDSKYKENISKLSDEMASYHPTQLCIEYIEDLLNSPGRKFASTTLN